MIAASVWMDLTDSMYTKLLIYENGYNDNAQSQYAYKLFNCSVIHVDLSLYSKNDNNKKLCMVEVGTKCSSQECSFLR